MMFEFYLNKDEREQERGEKLAKEASWAAMEKMVFT